MEGHKPGSRQMDDLINCPNVPSVSMRTELVARGAESAPMCVFRLVGDEIGVRDAQGGAHIPRGGARAWTPSRARCRYRRPPAPSRPVPAAGRHRRLPARTRQQLPTVTGGRSPHSMSCCGSTRHRSSRRTAPSPHTATPSRSSLPARPIGTSPAIWPRSARRPHPPRRRDGHRRRHAIPDPQHRDHLRQAIRSLARGHRFSASSPEGPSPGLRCGNNRRSTTLVRV